jgi:hypothetical protein
LIQFPSELQDFEQFFIQDLTQRSFSYPISKPLISKSDIYVSLFLLSPKLDIYLSKIHNFQLLSKYYFKVFLF